MVYNEKVGTELNLSLQLNEDERSKSLDLNVGYDKTFDEWTLIIKYIDNLDEIANKLDFNYTKLLGNFAIIRIKENQIRFLSNESNIIYIDKPKTIVLEQLQSITDMTGYIDYEAISYSCVNQVRGLPYELYGQGITVFVIDSGIDIYNRAFIDNGKTKIEGIWDQTLVGNPPNGYNLGSIFTRQQINEAISSNEKRFPSFDSSGHGTAVAGIVTSVAPKADLFIVKLGVQEERSFPRTAELMLGIDFAVNYSIDNNTPVVINMSFGNNYGDHNGNSILENFIDTVSGLARVSLITGSGNDGASRNHFQGNLGDKYYENAEFLIGDFHRGINIQIWKNYSDIFDIFIINPSGDEFGPINKSDLTEKYTSNNTFIAVLKGDVSPINPYEEIFISLIPVNTYIDPGAWKIRVYPKVIIDGRYDIWLPVEGSSTSDSFFLSPSIFTTLTIPSTSKRVVTVGAYNTENLSIPIFSGRGYTVSGIVKPDLVAPGVNISVPRPIDSFSTVSGTSFAAPFVSGGVALIMEWGIIDGNDPFLYGEKVKAYLIRGARQLPGFTEWPNPQAGWGALCVWDSLPR